ncbi:unnamed protein product [Phaedon cochleariae]|uniref:Peptidase S1 domain-containing protein n=1 Tax=Phaedon cochleariae TaxID=80249 RepID=A0A9P0DNV4_PHACE|nr:unnamed protein product [Phaedon cochleariae]
MFEYNNYLVFLLFFSKGISALTFGTDVKEKVPYQVAIFSPANNAIPNCNGALISEVWVVTSKKCIREMPVRLVLGATNIQEKEDHQVEIIIRSMEQMFSPQRPVDVTMVRLLQPVGVNSYIRPIKVGKAGSHHEVIVTSWGDHGGHLKESFTGIKSSYRCYAKGTVLNRRKPSRYEICTFGTACRGDHGAPLVFRDDSDKIKLVGILTSYEPNCRSFSDFYTRLMPLHNWFREIEVIARKKFSNSTSSIETTTDSLNKPLYTQSGINASNIPMTHTGVLISNDTGKPAGLAEQTSISDSVHNIPTGYHAVEPIGLAGEASTSESMHNSSTEFHAGKPTTELAVEASTSNTVHNIYTEHLAGQPIALAGEESTTESMHSFTDFNAGKPTGLPGEASISESVQYISTGYHEGKPIELAVEESTTESMHISPDFNAGKQTGIAGEASTSETVQYIPTGYHEEIPTGLAGEVYASESAHNLSTEYHASPGTGNNEGSTTMIMSTTIPTNTEYSSESLIPNESHVMTSNTDATTVPEGPDAHSLSYMNTVVPVVVTESQPTEAYLTETVTHQATKVQENLTMNESTITESTIDSSVTATAGVLVSETSTVPSPMDINVQPRPIDGDVDGNKDEDEEDEEEDGAEDDYENGSEGDDENSDERDIIEPEISNKPSNVGNTSESQVTTSGLPIGQNSSDQTIISPGTSSILMIINPLSPNGVTKITIQNSPMKGSTKYYERPISIHFGGSSSKFVMVNQPAKRPIYSQYGKSTNTIPFASPQSRPYMNQLGGQSSIQIPYAYQQPVRPMYMCLGQSYTLTRYPPNQQSGRPIQNLPGKSSSAILYGNPRPRPIQNMPGKSSSAILYVNPQSRPIQNMPAKSSFPIQYANPQSGRPILIRPGLTPTNVQHIIKQSGKSSPTIQYAGRPIRPIQSGKNSPTIQYANLQSGRPILPIQSGKSSPTIQYAGRPIRPIHSGKSSPTIQYAKPQSERPILIRPGLTPTNTQSTPQQSGVPCIIQPGPYSKTIPYANPQLGVPVNMRPGLQYNKQKPGVPCIIQSGPAFGTNPYANLPSRVPNIYKQPTNVQGF